LENITSHENSVANHKASSSTLVEALASHG
jgi:hypothetical protein